MPSFAVLALFREVDKDGNQLPDEERVKLFKTTNISNWNFLDSAGYIYLPLPEQTRDQNIIAKIQGKSQNVKLSFKITPTVDDLSCGTNNKWATKDPDEEISVLDQARWLDKYFVTEISTDKFRLLLVDFVHFGDIYLDTMQNKYTIDITSMGEFIVPSLLQEKQTSAMVNKGYIPNGLYGVFNNLDVQLKGDGAPTADVDIEFFIGDNIVSTWDSAVKQI